MIQIKMVNMVITTIQVSSNMGKYAEVMIAGNVVYPHGRWGTKKIVVAKRADTVVHSSHHTDRTGHDIFYRLQSGDIIYLDDVPIFRVICEWNILPMEEYHA